MTRFDMNAGISIIEKSNMFPSEKLAELLELKDELADTFSHAQMFRTRTEMEMSVLKDMKHPTADAKYWQAQKEQGVMFHELVLLSYEYRKNHLEIRKLLRDQEQEHDNIEHELMQIEIERRRFAALNQERTAEDRLREIKEWHSIKKELKSGMKYSLTDCDEHQLISYTKRWIQQFFAMGDSGNPSERHNLLGQLEMGLRACKEKGFLAQVLPMEEKQKQYILEQMSYAE